MSKPVIKIPIKRRTLRVYLDDAIRRGKKNNHVGAARTADLKQELTRIGELVSQTLTTINKEAAKDLSPQDNSKVIAKLEQTIELLTSELMRLSAIYHRQIDTNQIRRFLSEQQEIIRTSMNDGEQTSITLDDRVAELHSMMAHERSRISKNEHKERMKFSLSIILALTSLSVSIYALWLR